MSIKKLDPEVVSRIRSSFTVNSVAQCVFELVANSLDAKSTSIAIRINLLAFKIQVADNGEGITKENMHILGLRHTTNKLQKYKDLENLRSYGYRGEALASILEMCEKITITSRYKESNDTYIKDLSKVLKSDVKLGKYRASIGTTVTVFGWFSTVPVRRQRIIGEIELEEVKKHLESLIIINPQTSFTLRNDVTGLLILNIPKSPDIVDTFRTLHPDLSEAFTLLKVTKSKVTVRLLIQKELFSTKKIQYIYVNKRPVKSSKLVQHIYKASCSNMKPKNKQSLLFDKKKHPVYVMNIKCPQKCLDLTSEELELTCWDLVLTCIDKLMKIFFGFEEKDKPLVKAKREVKLNCGLSRIFGVVEATAYKRKSDETVLSQEDTSKKMCLDMLKPIEDNVTDKTKSSRSGENLPIENSPPIEKHESTKTKALISNQEQFDQKSTYSKLNHDEKLGKELILDMFLKSTQIYSSEEDINNDSKETIQEANMVFENQIKDHVKGTNTTMSISINVKKKKLKNKEKGVQTSQKPQDRKKGILKNPIVNGDDFGHNVTSKGVQTSLFFESHKEMYELTNTFQGFSLESSTKKDDYTIIINPNDGEEKYMFVKKRVEMVDKDKGDLRLMPLEMGLSEPVNFFRFQKPLDPPQTSEWANDGNYLQGMQYEQEKDNYEKYKIFAKPPLKPKPLKNSRAEGGKYLALEGVEFLQEYNNEKFNALEHPLRCNPMVERWYEGNRFPAQDLQFDEAEDNYENFKMPPLRSKPMIDSMADEGRYLPYRGVQFQQKNNTGKFNTLELPLTSEQSLKRLNEGDRLPFQRMQHEREEDAHEKCRKPSEQPLTSKPIMNRWAEEGRYLPYRGVQFRQENDRQKFNTLEYPLRSDQMVKTLNEDDRFPYKRMQCEQEEDTYKKFKKPSEPPPIINSRAREGRHLPFHSLQFQQENNHEQFNTLEPPLRSEQMGKSLNDCDRFPYQRMQLEQDTYEKYRKFSEPPLRSEPIINSRAEEGVHVPFRGMRFEEEQDNYRELEKPLKVPARYKPKFNTPELPLRSEQMVERLNEGDRFPYQRMQLEQEKDTYEKSRKLSEPPLRSEPMINSEAEEGVHLPFRGKRFEEEKDYGEFEKPLKLPVRYKPKFNTLELPLRSKQMVERLNEGDRFPHQRRQLERETDTYETFKKPLEPPLGYEPITNCRAENGVHLPFRRMQFEQEKDNYGKLEKPLKLPKFNTLELPLRSEQMVERLNEGDRFPYQRMQLEQEEDTCEKFKKPSEPPLRSKSIINRRAEKGSSLPFRDMAFQREEDNYENFRMCSEFPQTSELRFNEDEQGEDNCEKFKKRYEPPQISKPEENELDEEGCFPFQRMRIEQKNNYYNEFKKHLEPPLRSKPSEKYEGSYLPYPGMQQGTDHFEKNKNPLRSKPMIITGNCLPLQGTTFAPEKNSINNFRKSSEPSIISKPIRDNYFPCQRMHQFEQEVETFQEPSEPPLRLRPLEQKVANGAYLGLQGKHVFEQENGRFKKPLKPALKFGPEVKKTENTVNYMPFSGMHQIEQEENIYKDFKKTLGPPSKRIKQSNYLHFQDMQLNQKGVTEDFKKPSTPPPRVDRDNEDNCLPYRKMQQFHREKIHCEKFKIPAEPPLISKPINHSRMQAPENIQFKLEKNTYEPIKPPPLINGAKECNCLPSRERHQFEQQQNYTENFRKPSEPTKMKKVNAGNCSPFSDLQQDKWIDKPLKSRSMLNGVNKNNCLPSRGTQFEQVEDEYGEFKKPSEPPYIPEPIEDRVTSANDSSIQDMQFEQEEDHYEKVEKVPELPLISKPLSNKVKDNDYFGGIKKLPPLKPNQNGDIPSESPYFCQKVMDFENFKPKHISTQEKCIKSPTDSTKTSYINQMPEENYHPANNQFHNFQSENHRNQKNVPATEEPGNDSRGQFIDHQNQENVNPNRCYYPGENWNQCTDAPPEIVPDEAMEQPSWFTPNVSNDDFYIERSPKADNGNNFSINCSPNIYSNVAQTQKELKSFCNLEDFGCSNAHFHKELGPKKSDEIFDLKSACSPNIFSSEPPTQKDLKGFCNLQDLSPTGLKMASSNLEISIPNKDGQMEIIQKDLCDLRKNNFELVSMESDSIMEETKKSLEKSRVIVSSQNEWLRQVNDNGKTFFFNKRTGMVTHQAPKISQTKFDFDERLDFVPKGLSPALKGHEKVEKLLSQKAKNRLHDLILEGYEDELMVIKWQNFIGNSPKTFFENIYQEKSKQFEANVPSVHENALKIPKDFVNFNKKIFRNLSVLGQLDHKFIVAYESTKDLLILFDQHAVHERIRVERLSKEYKGIKTSYKGQMTFFLQHNDLSLLKNNLEYLESLGLGVDFMTNGLQITDIPLCIQEKVNIGNQVNSEDLNKILNVLIKDTVEFLKFSRGSAGTMMPKILQNIINLRACRGAIKFGDVLTGSKCGSLLKELSKCMLPFQCAHGRPTLSPIVTLGKIDVCTQIKKPNLKKLLKGTEN